MKKNKFSVFLIILLIICIFNVFYVCAADMDLETEATYRPLTDEAADCYFYLDKDTKWSKAEIEVLYNANVMNFISAEGSDGIELEYKQNADNINIYLKKAEDIPQATNETAILHFKAKAVGLGYIKFLSVKFYDRDGKELDVHANDRYIDIYKNNKNQNYEYNENGGSVVYESGLPVEVTIGDPQVYIYGTPVGDPDDPAPYIQYSTNSTLVPLRMVTAAICGFDTEKIDSSSAVRWDPETKTATVIARGKVINFCENVTYMTINGIAVAMEFGVYPEIKDGRMFVPFRALAFALDVSIEWDADTKTAIFNYR